MGFIIGYGLGQMQGAGDGLVALYEYCQQHPEACEPSKGDYFVFGILAAILAALVIFMIGAAVMIARGSQTDQGGGLGGKGLSANVALPPEFSNRKS